MWFIRRVSSEAAVTAVALRGRRTRMVKCQRRNEKTRRPSSWLHTFTNTPSPPHSACFYTRGGSKAIGCLGTPPTCPQPQGQRSHNPSTNRTKVARAFPLPVSSPFPLLTATVAWSGATSVHGLGTLFHIVQYPTPPLYTTLYYLVTVSLYCYQVTVYYCYNSHYTAHYTTHNYAVCPSIS